MKEANSFFDDFTDNLVGSLHTCCFARIERFDPVLMQADITPLYEDDVPLIQNVPVNTIQTTHFIIRAPYEVGDIVLVVFSQRDIDFVLYGDSEQSVRMMGIDDAVIVGGIIPFTKPLPVGYEDDLIIATKDDFNTKLVFRKDGSVLLEALKDIDIISKENVNITGQMINFNEG
ncbi:Gp138 family membrane-puncturing spike protein [Bacillus sp. JJ722]|uniref:Gp138 family membrane-puncturing spike protein n=1 Tax=Bacillus sp. JJ722 TaxID=3122973 RepID=UPI002FFE63BB